MVETVLNTQITLTNVYTKINQWNTSIFTFQNITVIFLHKNINSLNP